MDVAAGLVVRLTSRLVAERWNCNRTMHFLRDSLLSRPREIFAHDYKCLLYIQDSTKAVCTGLCNWVKRQDHFNVLSLLRGKVTDKKAKIDN